MTAGGCCTWPLALDGRCAAQARTVFREAVATLRLPDEVVWDGVTMASELAANTRHALGNVEVDGAGDLTVVGAPEMWVYLRRSGGRWELVCKVFDSLSGWQGGHAPAIGAALPEAPAGRGLQIVAGLSGGRWGHHLTRSRLGGWRVPGKVVWFARPVPDAGIPARLRRARLAPGQAARALEAMLVNRGLGGSLLRAEEPNAGMSVLSVRSGLTVWCRPGVVWWRTRDGRHEQRSPTDLVDIEEQLVAACAEMDNGIHPPPGALGRIR